MHLLKQVFSLIVLDPLIGRQDVLMLGPFVAREPSKDFISSFEEHVALVLLVIILIKNFKSLFLPLLL